ncbi:uncharacterized protein L969DRAFT_24170 [Mixia osmundae IAM 14324]|uniref:Catalase n=1 Tax=Mixia osmundae (strain CBS 9802 / IAM 14324 / JCM 22182 / KY 12970) TaxID=764103 RepID=G7E490_MIXOS|nr:uncharacterized protein L969DRAFT_24170 [Mixia osmundae IAM 14324]KEI39746.1 hypothetical protein L969DRAFT_24170 [Mixia osmundae IAM 14324]GAA97650.1 hypothetical protein E5Q_04328 [Mixia osmundae IAM 14324]
MSFAGQDGLISHGPPPRGNAKTDQLEQSTWRAPRDGTVHGTVFNNAPADNIDTSMKAGFRGPVTIADNVARERISNFDHERIPERVIHARGTGLHGFFKLHTSMEDVTCAKVLTEVGKETPMFVRFSTVLGSAGAAETAREVRGFSTRFYTDQGNWDIVGNNIPIFFINDGVKFVDLIHAGKPEPGTHIPQAQTAHDNFWDYISLTPESSHMIAWILSDYTIPRSYRHMRGAGVNTFTLVNAAGKSCFVKFHWKPHLGTHSLTWDEAWKLGGVDPDYLRRDLAEAITAIDSQGAEPPMWELGLQILQEENERDFDFDILDCTKLWPEELVPIKYVGTMTLNRLPTNYFEETEKVAFGTSNVVPGIGFSNDPMLAFRNFSYHDTQLIRLGGPNFNQIPINKSLCPFITTARDGHGANQIRAMPNYHPNRFDLPKVGQQDGRNFVDDSTTVDDLKKLHNPNALTYPPTEVKGAHARQRPRSFENSYNQAALFYNSLSPSEKTRLIATAHHELGRCDVRIVQERMIARFNEIDHDLAVEVAAGFGIEVPASKGNAAKGRTTTGSLPISMLDSNNTFTAKGRKIAMFCLDGYDGLQAKAMMTALMGAGVIVQVIGSRKGPAYPKGVEMGNEKAAGVISTNFTPESCRSLMFDAVFFPSGDEKYVKSLKSGRVTHFAREAFGHFKAVAAAGTACTWLMKTALLDIDDPTEGSVNTFESKLGLVLSPNLTEQDSSIWSTIKGVGESANFATAFVNAIAAHRCWERDVSSVAY